MNGGINMTNEEFQKIVLEELRGLKEGQEQLVGRIERLEIGQKQLEVGQGEIRKDIKTHNIRIKQIQLTFHYLFKNKKRN